MTKAELLEQAAENRELANRARRMAAQVTDNQDRGRALAYAEELDGKAADLEKQAAAA